MENKVNVLAVGDPAVSVYVNNTYKILERFEESSGIKVNFDIVPWDAYFPKLTESLQEKNCPYDVVMVAGHFWLKDFVESGYLRKMDRENDDDVLPVIRQELMVDGKTYLVPSFCDGHILLYRPSILEPIFGKLDEVVTTDKYSAMAKTLGENALAMKAHPSEIFLDFLPFLRSRGVEPFGCDGQVNVSSKEAETALHEYIELKSFALEGTENLDNDGVREAFQKKKVPMTVTWGGQLGEVLDERCQDPDDVGFAALSTSWNVTWSFGIPATASNAQLAEKLLDYLGSSEIDRLVGAFAGSPVRKSTYQLDSCRYPWYDVHLKLIETYAKPLPSLKNFGEMVGHLYEQVYLAFTGECTPEEALAAAQAAIEKVKS